MTRIIRTTPLAALLAGLVLAMPAQAESILFWSTQAKLIEETQRMREQVLAGFDGEVDFQPQDFGPFFTRMSAEVKAGEGTIGVLGALHGDLIVYATDLIDLSGVIGDAKINPGYLDLGKLGTDEQKYIPWMHAGYVMAANKQALQYLPQGADIDALTYDQLIAWGKAMREASGSSKIGFPAGPKGLMHRFFQGFLYPSYTHSVVTKFRSPEAEAMWSSFKTLWAETNPASTGYGVMQEPLLTGEVWVAWDHSARLPEAFNQKPDEFVAFPVPAGPAGRGFMPAVVGLAMPKTAPDAETAKKLVAYMLKPETQIATLRATSFFPVIDMALPDDLPPGIKAAGAAIAAQTKAADAMPSLLPIGLGNLSGKFNKVFADTFQRIVLNGEAIRPVLDEQGAVMKSLIDEAKAPCWAPDKASDGVCPVE